MDAVLVLVSLLVQLPEATAEVRKDAISVHRVERGTMPLRAAASGSLSSIEPARAVVMLSASFGGDVRTGQSVSIQIKAPGVVRGKVARIERNAATGGVSADIALGEPLPEGIAVGARVEALIDIGELHDVVYFARSSNSSPNSEGTIYRIEPDGQHAQRVVVRYGRAAGPLMEILAGLEPGDRVIVSDTSPFAVHARVRLR